MFKIWTVKRLVTPWAFLHTKVKGATRLKGKMYGLHPLVALCVTSRLIAQSGLAIDCVCVDVQFENIS